MRVAARNRRAARRMAVDVLYESAIREIPGHEVLARRRRHGWVVPSVEDDPSRGTWDRRGGERASTAPEGAAPGAHGRATETPSAQGLAYGEKLIRGVEDKRAAIDAQIESCAERWELERMPVLDLTVLRIGAFELLWGEVPVAVAINEAVELAKTLSTEASGGFVNGVLACIAQSRQS